MDLPENSLLPFFVYGLFKPGELGFIRLRPYVRGAPRPAEIEGSLLMRDGLPLLKAAPQHWSPGYLLEFQPEKAGQAYYRVVELEPDRLYRWETTTARVLGGERVQCNTLIGRNPERGSVAADAEWSGSADPLFVEGLGEVRRIIAEISSAEPSHVALIRAQMAYLLLWTSIERFASIRYHLGQDVVAKVMHLAREPTFQRALRETVKQERHVFRADRPDEKVVLRPNDTRKALEYYYQVRSNTAHRGKGAPARDFEIVRSSLIELTHLFSTVLQSAFIEANLQSSSEERS
jgi:hypothetical protein